MTEAQKFKFYFPAWNRCVRANGWFTREGAAVVDEARLNEEGRKVLAIARQRAAARQHRPTLDDLRHAAHIVALGRDKSSEHLTNADVDHVVALFNLLANPLDIGARSTFDAYQRGENPGAVKRQKYFIHTRAPEAVLRKLTYDLTSGRTRDPEALDDTERKELARLLAQRPVYGHRPKIQQKATKETKPSFSSLASVQKPDPKNYVLNPQLTFTKSGNPDW